MYVDCVSTIFTVERERIFKKDLNFSCLHYYNRIKNDQLTQYVQNNFQPYADFVSCLIYSSVLIPLSIIYITGSQRLQY